MIGKNGETEITRISRIAFLGILLLALCAPLFSQSQGGANGKIEPALKSKAERAARSREMVPAIVQFSDDKVSDQEKGVIIQRMFTRPI